MFIIQILQNATEAYRTKGYCSNGIVTVPSSASFLITGLLSTSGIMGLDRAHGLGFRQPFGQAKARWESFNSSQESHLCLSHTLWHGKVCGGHEGQRRMGIIMAKSIELVSRKVSLLVYV